MNERLKKALEVSMRDHQEMRQRMDQVGVFPEFPSVAEQTYADVRDVAQSYGANPQDEAFLAGMFTAAEFLGRSGISMEEYPAAAHVLKQMANMLAQAAANLHRGSD